VAKKSLVKGGVLGVIVGVVGGILFAPKSGKETREDIKEAATKANHEAEAKLKELHQELKEKADEAKVMADQYTGKAKEELEGLSKRAEFTKQKISELISAVREFEAEEAEVNKALEDGKSVVKKIIGAGKTKATASKSKATKKK